VELNSAGGDQQFFGEAGFSGPLVDLGLGGVAGEQVWGFGDGVLVILVDEELKVVELFVGES
jgi:hypothetical protein